MVSVCFVTPLSFCSFQLVDFVNQFFRSDNKDDPRNTTALAVANGCQHSRGRNNSIAEPLAVASGCRHSTLLPFGFDHSSRFMDKRDFLTIVTATPEEPLEFGVE